MKKIASILILVFAFTFTTEAQKRKQEHQPNLTGDQMTTLAVKKMTLTLDLSEKQQNQIKPLISAQIASKKGEMLKRKEYRAAKKKPSADEIFEMKNKQLDNRIAFKSKMKDILNKEQFEKFEKMTKGRKAKGKKMMMMKKMADKKSEKGRKERKGKKECKEEK